MCCKIVCRPRDHIQHPMLLSEPQILKRKLEANVVHEPIEGEEDFPQGQIFPQEVQMLIKDLAFDTGLVRSERALRSSDPGPDDV